MATTTLNLSSYLAAVRKSGLLDSAGLEQSLQTFQQEHAESAEDSQAFAEYLQERKLLTAWQNEKLLQGKHRGFFLGKYKLLRHIGSGGMSRVFLAEHTRLKRQVAIKILPSQRVDDASYLERFLLEARAIASLDHPNIVRAYDVNNEKDTYYMVIEYIDGQDFEKKVQEQGPLEPLQAAEFIRQAAEGLAHAHGRGMIHRDIKPGNLLLDQDGVVRILDMGLARLTNLEHSVTIEHNEHVLGTADYLAPEQAINSHNIDQRADIYSLGCSLYFLLSGHVPFPKGTLAQRLMKHQVEEPEPIESQRCDVPEGLLEVYGRMVRKKPDDRYQSAEEVAEALAEFLESAGQSVVRRTRTSGSSIRERPSTMTMRLSDTKIAAEEEETASTETMAQEETEEVQEISAPRARSSSARMAAIALGGLVSLALAVGLLIPWPEWSMDWSLGSASASRSETVPLNQYIAGEDVSFGERKLLDFTIPENGSYELFFDLKSSLPGKSLSVQLDGVDLHQEVSLQKAQEVSLGDQRLAAGRHQLALKVKSDSKSANWVGWGEWRIIGPFPFDGKSESFKQVHPPEKELEFKKEYQGTRGKKAKWKWKGTQLPLGKKVDLRGKFGVDDMAICYVYCKVKCNQDQQLSIFFGHDDGAMVWLNGKEIYYEYHHAQNQERNQLHLPLKKGNNDLLMKINQHSKGWHFYIEPQGKGQPAVEFDYGLRIEHRP